MEIFVPCLEFFFGPVAGRNTPWSSSNVEEAFQGRKAEDKRWLHLPVERSSKKFKTYSTMEVQMNLFKHQRTAL